MAYTTLTLEIVDHVAEVTLSRPGKLNTMVREFWQEMVDVFAAIEQTPSARAVIIASTGKHFTAGIDLGMFADIGVAAQAGDPGRIREQLRRTVLEMQEPFNAIERCRVPVLVAVQGGCIGGGVDLISACDIRYCTEDAFFCIQEINVGLTADVGTLQRLPHLIPAGMVRELAYTGRRLYGPEAKQIGLVNELYADADQMLTAVRDIARTIAKKSPLAVAGTKEMLTYARDHPVGDALNYMSVWQSGMLLNEDLMAQMQANKEKREADFQDLLAPRKLVHRRD